jgi:N-acetylmuramoyl-L-alanine amidase
MHPNHQKKHKKPRSLFCTAILLLFLMPSFAAPVSAGKLDDAYFSARRTYQKLLKSPKQRKYRHYWVNVITKFQTIYKKSPRGRWADNALFMVGRTYRKLYRYSGRKSDAQQAITYYERMIREFPSSVLADDALFALAEIALNVHKKREVAVKYYTRLTTRYPKGDYHAKAKAAVSRLSSSKSKYKKMPKKTRQKTTPLVNVAQLRFWSNPTYTRVVIDTEEDVSYSYRLLKKDPSIQKPQRLYIDLDHAKIGSRLSNIIPIQDDLLKDARVAQHTPTSVRIVLDIKTIDTFKIFSLQNPFRIVIDVNGKGTITAQKTPPVSSRALAKQLALNVNRIVIDPGHGGKDCGAPGYYKGVFEKDITLQIAKKLGEKIQRELGCNIFYTRTSDKFLPLEERTAIANTKNADLFISIHANATKKRHIYGIETYLLNLATDNDAIMVAARENATSAKNISDLEIILNELMRNSKINESTHLASCIQNKLVQGLKRQYSKINDLGVKQAPFYVLLGAEMPSVLIEIGFISNKRECKRLTNPKYQEHLVDGIAQGIKHYIKGIKPSVMMADTAPPIGG